MNHAERERWRAKDVARLLALLEAERRYYSEIVAALPLPVALLSRDRDILSVNRAFRDLMGSPTEELTRRRIEDLIPFPEIKESIRQALSDEECRTFQLAGDIPTGLGVRRMRLVGRRSQGWEEGTQTEVLIALEDLSGSAEAPQQESLAAPLRPLPASHAPAVIWELAPNLERVVAATGSNDVIPGYEPLQLSEFEEFPGPHVRPLDRDRYAAFYRELASGNRSSGQCEYRAGTPSTWLLDTALAETDVEGRVTAVFVVTIAVAEKRLRDKQMEQSAALNSLARATGRVAHNCNNLLMVISGYCEELAETHPGDNQLRADLDEIQKASERLAAFVSRLQSTSRKVASPCRSFDVNQVLREAEASCGPAAQVLLQLNSDPLPVRANREEVEQAVRLLISLFSVSPALSVSSVEVEWPAAAAGEQRALPPGMYAAVTFAGDVPEETVHRAVIEPDLDTKDEVSASPALAAIHRSLQLNDASLVVWNDGSGQTSVVMLLPKTEMEPAAEVPPEEPSRKEEERRTILIVEDENGIRSLMRKILDRQGFRVIDAGSGEEAVNRANEYTGVIHLLLTDMHLGSESGRELAEKLRESRPGLSVLYVSGFTDDPIIQEAVLSGKFPPGVGYLQKPFTLSSLLGRVHDVLDK